MREISIRTEQPINKFDVVIYNGFMFQKIGSVGDYDLFEEINWDDTIEPIELDVESIIDFDEGSL